MVRVPVRVREVLFFLGVGLISFSFFFGGAGVRSRARKP